MRRGKICARQIDAGPGSCSYWWESCPKDVRRCFNRYIREHGGTIDRAQAEAWDKARATETDPEPPSRGARQRYQLLDVD